MEDSGYAPMTTEEVERFLLEGDKESVIQSKITGINEVINMRFEPRQKELHNQMVAVLKYC